MQLYKTPRIQDYDGDLSRRWYIEYAYRNPDTGKFKIFREWVSACLITKTTRYVAAKTLRDNIQRKLEFGYDPFTNTQSRVTIEKALAEIVTLKRLTLRKRTANSYASIATMFCDWLTKSGYGDLAPHQITYRIAQAYFDFSLKDQKISPRTYNNRLRTLRTLFHVLTKREFLEYNVFTKIELLRETESTLRAYTPSEKILIRDALENKFPELWLCAMFVYYCFIRPQELCRLQFHDINFENKILCIPGSKSKNKKTAYILIPDQLMQILIGMGYDKLPGDKYIFSNSAKLTPGEKEISPNRMFNQWQIFIGEALGIRKGIYLFKHTGAGELFDGDAHPRNIQLQLRHASLEETVKYLEKYSNRPNENLRKYFLTI